MAKAQASVVRVEAVAALRQQIGDWRAAGQRIAFVPTMGALHNGHLSLVRHARDLADRVVVSVFVNPTQFGPGEDLETYPRDTERDCHLLTEAGCHLVFLPTAETIYPLGNQTWVEVSGASSGFEGEQRPGHFRGVATVVLKLFQAVQPDVAIFGEKDAQQLAVIRQLTRDLLLPIDIVGHPIVREADGLAMSSRNVYLSPEERREATVLFRSLTAVKASIEAGERNPGEIERQIRTLLDTGPRGSVDYVGIVNADNFEPMDELRGRCAVVLAYRLGNTRLLDNLQIDLALDPLTYPEPALTVASV